MRTFTCDTVFLFIYLNGDFVVGIAIEPTLTCHVCQSYNILTMIAHSFARTKINNNRVDPLPFWSFVSNTIGVHCLAFFANHWPCHSKQGMRWNTVTFILLQKSVQSESICKIQNSRIHSSITMTSLRTT